MSILGGEKEVWFVKFECIDEANGIDGSCMVTINY